ncbi:phage tail protein [Dactylosporangium sp. CS-047395]|uniref:phage tail protein n=1 Tax=Dactylosporangium sp. CS-047395 TaxID=3239936 RepID=UPI003D936D1F
MTTAFVGEIRMFAGNFAPAGWALCNGQLLPIAQNTMLFSILGTLYGGNGVSTFGLPDLRGATPVCIGQGPGLSDFEIGQTGGEATVALTVAEMPAHTHTAYGAEVLGDHNSPAGATWAESGLGRVVDRNYATAPDGTAMAAGAITTAGSGQGHDNWPPYLTLTFIIAITGTFPPRP